MSSGHAKRAGYPAGLSIAHRVSGPFRLVERYSVRIESQPRPAAPDVASVRAQDVPQLQGSTPGFVLGDVRVVQRSSGPVVLVTYGATSAPNPVTGKSVTEAVERYAFWRSGQEVVLTLSGPKGADNVDPWRKITDSVRWQW